MGTKTVITYVMEPLIPETYTVITVGGFTGTTRLFAFRIGNEPSRAPDDGTREPHGSPMEVPVVQNTGEVLTIDLPPGEYGLTALQTTDRFDVATAWIANRPRVDWADYSATECGGTLRLLGRNFVPANLYDSTAEAPLSYGGFRTGQTRCVARLVGGNAGSYVGIPVVRSSCYETHLNIPADLAPGEYDISVHNGLGGALGWSEPFRLAVKPRATWPDDVFEVDGWLKEGRGVDDAITAALAGIEKNGGGILEFAARVYPITRTIVLPRRTVMRGAGMDRTMIRLPVGEGPRPPYVAITGDGDFVVEDMRIQAVHCPVLIAAPRVEAGTWEAGMDAVETFGERRARNVTVRRCHLVTHAIGGHMRRKDKAQLDRVVGYMRTGHQRLGGYFGILIRGTDVTVQNNIIQGGGNCIGLQHIEHAVVSDNTLRVGASGTGIFCGGKLEWPANHPTGGGAKVIGHYSREILIADNDVSGISEFTRNLVMIYAGSENIHFARNNLHDIAPTTDGESFLTHAWPARWIKPRIRMTAPTTGRIIDPEGEVTHECLEGAFIEVIDGCGIGQLRRVVSRDGDKFEIEKPWKFTPDENSQISFSAPPPFHNMTLIDNCLRESPINVILYGYTHDVVIDGNHVSDGPGITLWSLRIEAAQKVWGGLAFTSIVNNVCERDWTTVAGQEDSVVPFGITFIGSNYKGVTDGYDLLGLIVRNNRLKINSGIRLKMTFPSGYDGVQWRVREYGLTLENNRFEDSHVGAAVEKGAQVVMRSNTSRNVTIPLKWVEAETWWRDSV